MKRLDSLPGQALAPCGGCRPGKCPEQRSGLLDHVYVEAMSLHSNFAQVLVRFHLQAAITDNPGFDRGEGHALTYLHEPLSGLDVE